ncbi:Radical SAM family enzyme [Candidatus Burkholderia pumila]|uniref:Heme chaperone HemW n=1 Tax=Candidatus Burkholderia pumila TaxID=1090375 RepID=A0ABR5HLI1_9BURK|nr:Radical SAM family enzyme [Candidatus Burkholderia pumila]
MSAAGPKKINVVQAFTSPGNIRLASLPPLSLYVHFPWCVRKCPYCDFNSHEWRDDTFPEERYLDALRADLEIALPLVWGRHVHTIFIGGGTPSLLSAHGLDRLLSDTRALLPIDADAEITLEANPGTFEAAKFASFRASGVNRLSIGIQSFNEAHLKVLGRIHDATQACKAVEIAAKHFDNFNLDLMFALSQQSLDECRHDIETAMSFAPPHLSLYHLTIEPNTVFAKYPPVLPDDASADMQDWIHERTREAGYERYEVSAYAKPHRQSRHNLNYWRFGDYLGIGAGAHTKLSFPTKILRQARFKHPASYMDHALSPNETPIQEKREVGPCDLPFEFMLNTLRLVEGFPVHAFVERTGLALSTIEPVLVAAEKRGLITRNFERIAPTELGQRFLNDLQEMFVKDAAK